MGETVGLAEKIGRFMIFRPAMRIEHRGERKIEDVAVNYPSGAYDVFGSPSSTGTVTSHDPRMATRKYGHARYVRVWVYNAQGFPAHRCRVFVERIWLNGRLVESERFPLHWSDRDGVYELPGEMPWLYRNGAYVDVCSSDSIHPIFQVISRKWTKGYHRFTDSGVYKLELTAESDRPCWRGHFALTVSCDPQKWDSLKVVSAKECPRFMGWAWSAN
jgi:hypothetical protein